MIGSQDIQNTEPIDSNDSLPPDDANEGEEDIQVENPYINPTENIDKLNTYYSLKTKYEENKKLDKKKPACVNCKRNVGSKFEMKFNKDENHRKLIAKCGDTNNPCSLNIEINLSPVYTLQEVTNEERKKLSINQENSIKITHDLLFGYSKEEDELTKEMHNFQQDQTKYQLNLTKLLNIIDDPIKKQEIETKQVDFYNYIKEYKSHILEFENTRDKRHLQNANELYVNTITPIINDLKQLKYSLQNISHNNNKHTLELKEYTIDMFETTKDNKPFIEIVHYTILPNAAINEAPSATQQRPTRTKPNRKQPSVKNKPRENPETKTRKNRAVKNQEEKEEIFKNIDTVFNRLSNDEFDNMTTNQLITMIHLEPTKENKEIIQNYYSQKIVEKSRIIDAINNIIETITEDEMNNMNMNSLIARLEEKYNFTDLKQTYKQVIKSYYIHLIRQKQSSTI
jgi:hypothetical protein